MRGVLIAHGTVLVCFAVHQSDTMTPEYAMIQRQAFAGLLWGKQFYHFGVDLWCVLCSDTGGMHAQEERSY